MSNSNSNDLAPGDFSTNQTDNSHPSTTVPSPHSNPSTSPAGILKFLHAIENLKRTKRTGWVENGIADAESIADHMHRMGILSLLLPQSSPIDRTRCIKMSIVHDLAECIVGDLTPHGGISKAEKHKRERDAMDELVDMLQGSVEAEEIRDLWKEYEDAATEEALFVKDLDKFEMIVQALEYEK
ncbi:hypothetical protein HKX48_003291, partial [Thoreauomyces humboldtii]